MMVIFLLKEGSGLFQKSPIEEQMSVVVNQSNSLDTVTAHQLKLIFDQEITYWSALNQTINKNSTNDSIILFRIDDIANYYSEEQLGEELENIPSLVSQLVDSIPTIIAFIPEKYIFNEFKGKKLKCENTTLKSFLEGREWLPTAKPAAQFGVLPLIMGTLLVSLIAILIALPIGLSCAVYLSELANQKWRSMIKPVIDLLAGIPSVVFGFFGLIVIVPQIQKLFDLPVGETALAGSIILAIMALPTVISVAEDSLRTTPKALREASLALGANKWQTIYKVVIPYAKNGIAAAAILGIGRAIGETMAVLMVTGNAAVIPTTLLEPVRTIPATIAAELGEAPQGGMHYEALFVLASILFFISFGINIIVDYITSTKVKSNSR